MAHAGLRSEVHDRSERAVAEQRLRGRAIGEIEPLRREALALAQHREARLFQRRVIVMIDAVDADDLPPVLEQPPRETEADEARGTGDQNWQGHSRRTPSRLPGFSRKC